MGTMTKAILSRLKIARKLRGYVLAKDFAAYANVSSSTYSQHETGKRGITIDQMLEYSSLLGVNPAWLLTGQGNPSNTRSELEPIDIDLLKEVSALELSGEIEAVIPPVVDRSSLISCVNIALLESIMYNAVSLLKNTDEEVDLKAFISFCFDLYNQLISVNASEDEMKSLLDMSVGSFFSGLSARKKDAFVKKIAMM